MKRMKEGEYGRCTLCSCMKIEQWMPSKSFLVVGGGWGRMKLTMAHCKNTGKCHNEPPCITNIY
jgi:hypothetical protein